MSLKRGIEISSAKIRLNWLHKWATAIWEMANWQRVKPQFSYLQAGKS